MRASGENTNNPILLGIPEFQPGTSPPHNETVGSQGHLHIDVLDGKDCAPRDAPEATVSNMRLPSTPPCVRTGYDFATRQLFKRKPGDRLKRCLKQATQKGP